MIFNHFDRIRVVSLPHRKDRRSEMLAQFDRVGLRDDARIEFFDALSFSDSGPFLRRGSHGNFKSRIPLLREAGEAGESILIFEDDCDFRVPQILEYEMPADWDIFYGGFTASQPEDPADSQIIGSHFMGFSPRAAKAAAEYLAAYLEPNFPPRFGHGVRRSRLPALFAHRRRREEMVRPHCRCSRFGRVGQTDRASAARACPSIIKHGLKAPLLGSYCAEAMLEPSAKNAQGSSSMPRYS